MQKLNGHENYLVSVIIPVKNEALKIKDCINSILSQSIPVIEIIVIDSGSTDGTIELLKLYPQVKLIQISPSQFNHGSTRNLGVQHAKGDYVLLTVGDAKAYNNKWIEELLNGFVDIDVVAVCGQQVVPHDTDKNPVDWFRPYSIPQLERYQFQQPNTFLQLKPQEKQSICGWDDVTAMYKREILLTQPFQHVSYAEDAIWANEALMNGYAIVYNKKAKVFHYHNEDAEFAFKRAFTTFYFRYKTFGVIPQKQILNTRRKLSIIKSIIKGIGLNPYNIRKWYQYNIENITANIKAWQLFMTSLPKGNAYLDQVHEKYCGTPPVPSKN